MSDERYDAGQIEEKWQRVWEEAGAWEVSNERTGRKAYVLEQLPYPSGTLHMGHMLVYTIGDVVAHFHRRNGVRMLHPLGWTRSACRRRTLPSAAAPSARAHRAQHRLHQGSMRRIGWATTGRASSPRTTRVHRWHQWQFLKMLERGLALPQASQVKWCPAA